MTFQYLFVYLCAFQVCFLLFVLCGTEDTTNINEGPKVEVLNQKKQTPKKVEQDDVEDASPLTDLIQDHSRFAMNLFHKAVKLQPDDNVVCSPASASIAVVMLYAAAGGNTSHQIKQAVFPSMANVGVSKVYSQLLRNLHQTDAAIELDSASGVFVDKSVRIKHGFSKNITKDFRGKIEALDFISNSETSRLAINDWVEERTHRKITNLLPVGSIVPQTVAVLVNAVYFKGIWKHKFDASLTARRSFLSTANTERPVDMMQMSGPQEEGFPYTEDMTNGIKVLGLPYKSEDVFMYIFLPMRRGTYLKVEPLLTGNTIANLISRANANKELFESISIPKFNIHHRIRFKAALEETGIIDAFSASANFSKMSSERLVLSDAHHKCHIEVNEEGTVAAAASGFGMGRSINIAKRKRTFIADNAFFYTIFHSKLSYTLFTGRYVSASAR